MFRSSPQCKKRSNQPSIIVCFFFNLTSASAIASAVTSAASAVPWREVAKEFIPHNAGFELFSPTLTRRASKLLPEPNDPTCFSIPHTAAPPAVARYNRVAIEKGRLVNWRPRWRSWSWQWLWDSEDCSCFPLNESALAAMLAFWIAFSIEGEYPPETSVPNPTYKITNKNIFHQDWTKHPYLDSPIQVISNRCNTTIQIEIASRAMTYPRSSLLY